MTGALGRLAMFAQIALRNLLASRSKTLIVGGIVGFGAFLVVVGTSLVDSVDRAMSRSIIGSVVGHIQVYSEDSSDDLDVLGGSGVDASALEPLPDFAKVKAALLTLPNVEHVVPMGVNDSWAIAGNALDRALEKLRTLVTEQRIQAGPERAAALAGARDHVRQMLMTVAADVQNAGRLQDASAFARDEQDVVRRAVSDELWRGFEEDPFPVLEFLENRLAPLAADAEPLILRYMGTDPAAFAQAFDRMRIVLGEPIPAGQKGFLFSQYLYEEYVKLGTPRALDQIKDARERRGGRIADDPELAHLVKEAGAAAAELVLQLDAVKAALLRAKLQHYLGSQVADIGLLLDALLKLTDENFEDRHAFFYRELAPSLELYRVKIGDELTIKAVTRSGYVQSVNVKVFGTFAFEGLEGSPQAGLINLMDLVTFRELYGLMTDARHAEITALRARAGAAAVGRGDAEETLFGARAAESSLRQATHAPQLDLDAELAGITRRDHSERTSARRYDPAQLGQGVILNAAVLVKDEAQLDETIAAIQAAGARLGLPLKAVAWHQAAGVLGQFATVARVVLYASVLIVFLVALVIINNALVMATIERVRDIGTLRAIGAQRSMIVTMLLMESAITGLIFGGIGAGLGAGLIAALGRSGIVASNDALWFFFSGPALHPHLDGQNLALASGVVLGVSFMSGVYPALIAMRVSPRAAMQSEE